MNDLKSNELEVLRLLWDESPRKAGDIQDGFGWDIDNGTLRSVLVAMVERGLLKRKKEGKAFVYSPRVQRETLLRRMIARMAEVFAGGSTGELLVALAEHEKLDPDAIKRLQQIASADSPEERSKKKTGEAC